MIRYKEPWQERLALWMAHRPWWALLAFGLVFGGLCWLAMWHNGRVQAECARSRCPTGLTGRHVEGAGCLCVTLPLPP